MKTGRFGTDRLKRRRFFAPGEETEDGGGLYVEQNVTMRDGEVRFKSGVAGAAKRFSTENPWLGTKKRGGSLG